MCAYNMCVDVIVMLNRNFEFNGFGYYVLYPDLWEYQRNSLGDDYH